MRYVITGASGFVGVCLLASLETARGRVLAISRRAQLNADGVVWLKRDDALRAQYGHGPDTTLLHLEVKQHVENPTTREIEEFQRVNVGGTQSWLDWCAKNGVNRFVLFSTIKAIRTDKLGRAISISEEENEGAESEYGQSKWQAEIAVRDWAREASGRSAVILRPAVIYGPRNTANIYSFVDAIYRGRFFLVGCNDNVKSIVSIQNLCSAVMHLMAHMKPGTEIYNVTDRQSYTVRELAVTIARLLNVRWKPRSIPFPLARAAAVVGTTVASLIHRDVPLTKRRLEALLETTNFSCAKLLSTGFTHPQTTEEGLREMVQWYLSNRRSAAE